MFLIDKDGRHEILSPIQPGKAGIEILVRSGVPVQKEGVADSEKMLAYLDWVLKEGEEFFR